MDGINLNIPGSSCRVAFSSFMKSLFILALLCALTSFVAGTTVIISVDFIHGNPHRSQQNAIAIMFIENPIISCILALPVMIIFFASQFLQATFIVPLSKLFVSRSLFAVVILIPLAAIVSWYSYDYLIPHDFLLSLDEDTGWQPYQHGITAFRYASMLIIQLIVSGFSLLGFYLLNSNRAKASRKIMLFLMVFCMLCGIMQGHLMAVDQYKFLQ
jgi:hypothetical protein